MKKWIMFLSLVCLLASSCAVNNFPRRVNAIERGMTNAGYWVDSVGARVIPKYRTGQRYSLNRQTPGIEYSYYWNTRFKKEPELFYPEPLGLPEVKVEKVLGESRDVKVDLISWPSLYLPQNPEFAVYYNTYRGPEKVYAVYLQLKTRSKGCVVISHDWTDRDVTDIWRKEGPLDYAKMGYDSLVIQQPYHGLRRLPNMAFSGEYFVSGEMARINEAMCQSVTDIRSAVKWLRLRYGVVGLKGTGLGGTTCLLTAVVEKNLDFVLAWTPPSSLGDIITETPMAPFVLRTIRMAGIDQETASKSLWVASPANYAPAIGPRRILIISGMGDRIVPPEQTEKINRRWGEINVLWYAGGQIANFQKRYCERGEQRFLLSFIAPKKKPEDPGKSKAKKDKKSAPKPRKKQSPGEI